MEGSAMAHSAKLLLQTSVQRPETTTLFRAFALRASRTFLSSQEFMEVRSSTFCSGNTSSSSG